MIQVKVLLFSVLKEKLGTDNLTIALDDSLTGKHLLDRLAAEYIPIQKYRRVIRLAVNESYAMESQTLSDGDEIALITPVSGG